jgi:NADPH:quinone reductase-like Zn-dependent oxidoreductase
MQAMQLRRYGSARDIEPCAMPQPVPGPTDVLVRVHAATVNDFDWGYVTGRPHVLRLVFGLRRPRVTVLGAEVSGEVAAVGHGVTAFKPGDRVFGDLSTDRFGSFAEYVLADQRSLVQQPAGMSDELAASLPHAGLLAWQGMVGSGRIRQGDRVLINGAGGGVGAYGLQIARAFGAEVTGVDAAGKLPAMTSLGFDHVIDYRDTDFARTGERYDLILDTKATRGPRALCRALRDGGRYVAVGGQLRRIAQILVAGPLVGRMRGVRLRILGLRPNRDIEHLLELWRTHGLRCPMEGPFSLAEVPRAMALYGSAQHIGKIVIRVRDPVPSQ